MKHKFSLNRFRMLSVLVILALLSSYTNASPARAATTYTLTDLGTLGGSESFARAINEAGQVIGFSYLAGNASYHAFLWEGGVMTDLGTFGGFGLGESFAYDINEAGQVVGEAYSEDYQQRHAFLWEGGVMTDLAPYESFDSRAGVINEAGQVLGAIDLDGEFVQAFVWKDGVLTRLLLSGHNSQAAGMNEAGQVIGYADTFDGTGKDTGEHAFLWENGVMTDLGTFGGGGISGPGNTDSYPTAINEAAQVIGYAYLANGSYHAFLWQGGVMTDLGTLGGSSSQAKDINEAGQVVGSAYTTGDAEQHAFLWQGGVMADLGTLGGSESVAYGINEAGQVIGYSYLAGDTQRHPFVWEGGVMTDLTLGGSDGQTLAINEAGQVIGFSTLAGDAERHAFVWEDGVLTDLTLGGSTSHPFAINEAGQVIGYSDLAGDASYHAFVTMSVTIQPPTTDAGGPYSVNEGASISVTATGNDPEGGVLTYAWDLDNDGTFETPGQSATFSAASLAGPSSYTIAVQVTDDSGLTATDQATVNVLDIAPPTTAEQLSSLTTDVNGFMAGGDISSGVGTALVNKLQTAQKKLESSQTNTTVNVLQAFMNSVEAQRGKKISAAAADDLMAQAQAIIEQLQP